MHYMNDSGELQDVEAICSGKLSHVPSQPAVVPSPCGMLSRDQSLRSDTWNLLGTSGKRFWQPTCSNRFVIDTKVLQAETQYEKIEGKPVAGSEERNRETIPTPRCARKPLTMNSFFPAEGSYPQNYAADQ